MSKRFSSADIIKILVKNGFVLDRIKGSHHVYFHPNNAKRAVVPHPKKDLPIGTAKSIFRQAGIEGE